MDNRLFISMMTLVLLVAFQNCGGIPVVQENESGKISLPEQTAFFEQASYDQSNP